jgi:ankyrin repeat protein
MTALIWASYEILERTDIVKILLEEGADVNAKDKYGRTALMIASEYGKRGLERKYQTEGPNLVGGLNTHYETAKVVKVLIENGADVNAQDDDGDTPLSNALYQRHMEIIKELIKNGADVNIKVDNGRTPLHIASDWLGLQNPEIIEILISKGADINARDNDGKTPLSLAKKGGRTEVAEILRKHGAKE